MIANPFTSYTAGSYGFFDALTIDIGPLDLWPRHAALRRVDLPPSSLDAEAWAKRQALRRRQKRARRISRIHG